MATLNLWKKIQKQDYLMLGFNMLQLMHGVITVNNIHSNEKIQLDTLEKFIEYMLHNKTFSPDIRG